MTSAAHIEPTSEAAPEAAYDAARFASETGVDAAALTRLQRLVALLEEANEQVNLVSRASLSAVWQRHVFDSAQLLAFVPEGAVCFLDMGSGAGFPGLVLAALLHGRPALNITLAESLAKKCAFLERAAEAMELGDSVKIIRTRIEDLAPFRADVITARAVARLPLLLKYARRFAGPETVLIFPKGKGAEAELTEARRSWRIESSLHESRSEAGAQILTVQGFAPLGRSGGQK